MSRTLVHPAVHPHNPHIAKPPTESTQPFFKAESSIRGKPKSKISAPPATESLMKSGVGTFRRKLAVYFVEHDCFAPTRKGIDHFQEPGEESLSRRKLKSIIRKRISRRIKAGEASESLLAEGYIRAAPDWKTKRHRVQALNDFLAHSGKGPDELTCKELGKNGMRGLLADAGDSLHAALVESGHAYSIQDLKRFSEAGRFWSFRIYPWQMSRAPPIFNDEEVRTAAIRWMVRGIGSKEKKGPERISAEDFAEHGLRYLLAHTGSCHYAALAEAGYAFTFDEVYKHSRKMRYDSGKIYPWQMDTAPMKYNEPALRIAATRWLAWKLKIKPRDIQRHDFSDNGLRGVLAHHKSLFSALDEAGLVRPEDEEYIRNRDRTPRAKR